MAWTSSPPGLCQIDMPHREAAACRTLFALKVELVIHPLIRQELMPLPDVAMHGPGAVPTSTASKDCQTQARAPKTWASDQVSGQGAHCTRLACSSFLEALSCRSLATTCVMVLGGMAFFTSRPMCPSRSTMCSLRCPCCPESIPISHQHDTRNSRAPTKGKVSSAQRSVHIEWLAHHEACHSDLDVCKQQAKSASHSRSPVEDNPNQRGSD